MSRLMSVSKTIPAVQERRKFMTRRLGWVGAKPSDHLALCEKVQGRRRKDGTVDPLVRLDEVEVAEVRRERLCDITDEDIALEAVDPDLFGEHHVGGRFDGQPTQKAWVAWFCTEMKCTPETVVTVLRWRYPDGGGSS